MAGIVTAIWNLRRMGDDPPLRDQWGKDTFKDHVTYLGQHVKFFLRWRVEAHLQTDSDKDRVTAAVAAEYDSVRAFMDNVIGLDINALKPLILGTDPSPHLDFADVLRVRTIASAIPANVVTGAQHERWSRAISIVWRAAALEPEVWTPDFSEAALPRSSTSPSHDGADAYQVSDTTCPRCVPIESAPHGPWRTASAAGCSSIRSQAELKDNIGAPNIGAGKVWESTSPAALLPGGKWTPYPSPAATVFTPQATAGYLYDFAPGANPVPASRPVQPVDGLVGPVVDLLRSRPRGPSPRGAAVREARRTGNDDELNSYFSTAIPEPHGRLGGAASAVAGGLR